MKIISLIFICMLSVAAAQKFGKCFTPDEYKGSCVYFQSCPSLFEITKKKPVEPRDRLFLALSQCGFRDGQVLVCCRDESLAPPAPLITSPPIAQTPAPIQQTQAPPVVSPGNTNIRVFPSPGVCGIDFQDRIYGGNVTSIDEFPWTALLGFSKPNNKVGYHCGGVLISNRYVLTASHCVNGKDLPPTWNLSQVRLGEWNTETDLDCDDEYLTEKICSPPTVDVEIEEKIPHPEYDPFGANQHNDIALLRLKHEVNFTPYVTPICMPTDQQLRDNTFVKQTLSVAGFGKTETRSASNLKLKVNVNGVSNEDCNKVYSREQREIIDTQVCAGGKKGEDSCRGDSGGPLMRQNVNGNPPYWYLAGLVSYGPSPCGMEGWPGVYTRVGKYVDWVAQNIKP